jgi:hypothetical protein
MPMYALATVPLIRKLSSASQITQTWHADDSSAAGHAAWQHPFMMGTASY